MPGGERLWRTDDGDLVPDGHPDARLLAYGPDDELDDGEDIRDLDAETEAAAQAQAEAEAAAQAQAEAEAAAQAQAEAEAAAQAQAEAEAAAQAQAAAQAEAEKPAGRTTAKKTAAPAAKK